MKNCICIGKDAGKDLIDEELMFCLFLNGKEYRTKITMDEYNVLSKVFRRLNKGGVT